MGAVMSTTIFTIGRAAIFNVVLPVVYVLLRIKGM